MKFTYALLLMGLLILAGTAGESDRNVYMPMWQMLTQSCVGLALFIWGAVRANKHEGVGG
jgi:hypothetical protein